MNKQEKIKKSLELYKELSKEINEANDEAKQKKNFYFVVRQPFDNYQRGDHITEINEIERIEKQRLLNLVMKVNTRN